MYQSTGQWLMASILLFVSVLKVLFFFFRQQSVSMVFISLKAKYPKFCGVFSHIFVQLFLQMISGIANSVDLDHTARLGCRLIWVCTLCICHFTGYFGVRRTSINWDKYSELFSVFVVSFSEHRSCLTSTSITVWPEEYWERLFPYFSAKQNAEYS